MKGKFNKISIKGISSAVPANSISNEIYFDLYNKKKVKTQLNLTGIENRHICLDNQSVSDLCYSAAKNLLESLNWDASTIQVLILVTQTPDYVLPATSFLLQDKLGIGRECTVFDINLGCSGYIVGLNTISAILENLDIGARGLLLTGDMLSKYIDDKDFSSCMIFGDAASATALEVEYNHSIFYMQNSYGTNYRDIFVGSYQDKFYMDGMNVFNFTISDVVEHIKSFKNLFQISEDKIDYYILHQAQKFILDNLKELCEIDVDKVLTSYENFGNTSVTSIPLTISLHSECLHGNHNLLLCGFGVGLSYGSIYVNTNDTLLLQPVFVD